MHFDIVMPKLGESVTEGTVARWLKEVGDPIARDESVLEITTDKIDTDVPAIEGGILSEILVTEGTTVDVGERQASVRPGVDDNPLTGDAGADSCEPRPDAEFAQLEERFVRALSEPVVPQHEDLVVGPTLASRNVADRQRQRRVRRLGRGVHGPVALEQAGLGYQDNSRDDGRPNDSVSCSCVSRSHSHLQRSVTPYRCLPATW